MSSYIIVIGSFFVATAATLLLSLAFLREARAAKPLMTRRASGFGLASFALLVPLGATWPSHFTLAAIAALPGTLALGWSLISPRKFSNPMWRYMVVAVFLSPGSWVYWAVWFVTPGLGGP